MRLYLDASAIIYSIESAPPLRNVVLSRILAAESTPGGAILTSRLSRLECRVRPLKLAQISLLQTYELFFTQPSLDLAEITAAVVERATDLRVKYKFKTPDAIHLATAIELGADALLTGDRDLTRCRELKVETP